MSNPFAATSGAAYAPPTATDTEQNEPLQMQSPSTTTLPPPQRVVLLFHVLFKVRVTSLKLPACPWPLWPPLVHPQPTGSVVLTGARVQALALLSFLLSRVLFSGSYVVTFVFVTILSALDFWTVKNVSGRLLVGLRWWNTIDDAGESKWYTLDHRSNQDHRSQWLRCVVPR